MPKTLDHLERRMLNAAINLAHGLQNVGGFDDVLPIDNISVEQTADGVQVHFIEKPGKGKKASKPVKEVDES